MTTSKRLRNHRRLGGEVLEYALIAGLIVVAAIAVIGALSGGDFFKIKGLGESTPLIYPQKE